MVCNYVLLLELEELFVVNKLSSKLCVFPLRLWICLQNISRCCGCSWADLRHSDSKRYPFYSV